MVKGGKVNMTVTITPQDKLSKHEGSQADLAAAEQALKDEQTQLQHRRTELAALAILDKDTSSQAELQSVVSRLKGIDSELEIVGSAKATLAERMAAATHEIAQDKRNKNIEAVMRLVVARQELLNEINTRTEALAEKVSETWELNQAGLNLSREFGDDVVTRNAFSNKHLTTAIEYLLGEHLYRFNVSAALRPGNWQAWSWQLSTQAPADLEQHLKELPLK